MTGKDLQIISAQTKAATCIVAFSPDLSLAAFTDHEQPTIYLWDLAKSYSGFFENCPVIEAETPALRASRFLLCDLTARVIEAAGFEAVYVTGAVSVRVRAHGTGELLMVDTPL